MHTAYTYAAYERIGSRALFLDGGEGARCCRGGRLLAQHSVSDHGQLHHRVWLAVAPTVRAHAIWTRRSTPFFLLAPPVETVDNHARQSAVGPRSLRRGWPYWLSTPRAEMPDQRRPAWSPWHHGILPPILRTWSAMAGVGASLGRSLLVPERYTMVETAAQIVQESVARSRDSDGDSL